jgi:hypothetical protein
MGVNARCQVPLTHVTIRFTAKNEVKHMQDNINSAPLCSVASDKALQLTACYCVHLPCSPDARAEDRKARFSRA